MRINRLVIFLLLLANGLAFSGCEPPLKQGGERINRMVAGANDYLVSLSEISYYSEQETMHGTINNYEKSDARLIGIDALGQQRWERIFSDTLPGALVALSGGRTLAVVLSPSYDRLRVDKLRVLMVDNRGETIWDHSTTAPVRVPGNYDPVVVSLDAAGTFSISGTYRDPTVASVHNAINIVTLRVDTDGNIAEPVLSQAVDFSTDGSGMVADLIHTSDGGIAYLAFPLLARTPFTVIKLAKNGSVQWQTTLDPPQAEAATHLVETAGGYLVSLGGGQLYDTLQLYALDAKGTITQQNDLGTKDVLASSLTRVDNHTYLLGVYDIGISRCSIVVADAQGKKSSNFYIPECEGIDDLSPMSNGFAFRAFAGAEIRRIDKDGTIIWKTDISKQDLR